MEKQIVDPFSYDGNAARATDGLVNSDDKRFKYELRREGKETIYFPWSEDENPHKNQQPKRKLKC